MIHKSTCHWFGERCSNIKCSSISFAICVCPSSVWGLAIIHSLISRHVCVVDFSLIVSMIAQSPIDKVSNPHRSPPFDHQAQFSRSQFQSIASGCLASPNFIGHNNLVSPIYDLTWVGGASHGSTGPTKYLKRRLEMVKKVIIISTRLLRPHYLA